MASAKEIRVAPIGVKDARETVKKLHYSGKVDPRSQLHLGVFLNGRIEGVMQFGPSMAKRKMLSLVEGTSWNGFIELNRMAFSDRLPRNSESRALSIAFRMIRKHYPHIEWVVSFADGTQCGDGTIYRASGFVLTGIKKNNSMFLMPDGQVICSIVLQPGFSPNAKENSVKARYGKTGSEAANVFLKRIGAKPLEGFQLRYIYFLNPEARQRLTVPILPFSKIDEMGARMYKGEKQQAGQVGDGCDQQHSGGATPTGSLQSTQAKP